MIHQYKLAGYNVVLDVCSGSVHVVDDIAYDMIGRFEEESRESLLAQMKEKYQNEGVTDEELSAYKRGKTIHTNSIPKSATALEYRKATGLEAVFGYLCLKGDTERMEFLLEKGFFEE